MRPGNFHAALPALLALACVASHPAPRYAPGPDLDGTPRRGGSAVFVREEDPDFLDPALSYGSYSGPVTNAVFRTLLNNASKPGVAGAALVPDLAAGLPDVRENGTLYCFRVRPDARFGPPVHRHITAADFKYSVERLFRVTSPGVGFYRGIVGADSVLAGRATELAGILARGDSLYVRLRHADPVFLQVFSMSFTAPLPREFVEKHAGSMSQHVIATGPFRVAEFVPRQRLLLVRNPDYCGPPAYLDTLEVRLGVTASNAVAQIRRGQADGGFFEVPPAEYARLHVDPEWARQIQVAEVLHTEYLFLNVTRKPFDDVRVRQAVAWAIDRRALVKAYSGKAIPAGEFLPPGMPGAVALGRYQGPDTARARALLRAAGYPDGFSTRLYGWTTEPGPREMAIMQQNLADVGIRVQLDLSEAELYNSVADRPSNRVPMGIYAWYADYVDPSNFFDVLLNGKRITPIHNNDLGMFDDATVNHMIETAMATRDDSARVHLWQAVDRRVMDLVPVVPLIHQDESRLFSPRLGGWYRHITRSLNLEQLFIKAPLAPAAPAAGPGRRPA